MFQRLANTQEIGRRSLPPPPPGEPRPPLLVIAGPTATGKTALALELANHAPIEVISADSRQVYRGLDIGTAKPTVADRKRVPHHLVDIIDPDEVFNAHRFAHLARAAIVDIQSRGARPVVVGGTGFYIQALLTASPLGATPPDPELRNRLTHELDTHGPEPLIRRLRDLAPDRAAAIDLDNPRRLIRALEIAESQAHQETPARPLSLSDVRSPLNPSPGDLSKAPFVFEGGTALHPLQGERQVRPSAAETGEGSSGQPPLGLGKGLHEARRPVQPGTITPIPAHVLGLEVDPEILADRIAQRTERMFQNGLLDEARRLRDRGYDRTLPALTGVGYAEALAHLDGQLTLPEAIQRTTIRTRQYARRQRTWFRHQLPTVWHPPAPALKAALHHLSADHR